MGSFAFLLQLKIWAAKRYRLLLKNCGDNKLSEKHVGTGLADEKMARLYQEQKAGEWSQGG